MKRYFAVVTLLVCSMRAPGSAKFVATESHSLLVAPNQSVCGVGENDFGQLGDGTKIDRFSPVTAAVLAGVTGVSTSWYHSLAVQADGTVWAWGYNNTGQLGDGSVTSRETPAAVPGLSGVIAVAAGQFHSLALRGDGTVWAWGDNGNGRLGDGSITSRLTPVRVAGLTGIVAIGAGQQHSLALKSDGTVWMWGNNTYGQLGNGTFSQSVSPTQVVGLTAVTGIASGANHILARRSDLTVWSWGANVAGQLGNGTLASQPTPVPVSLLTNVVDIAGGFTHSLAVRADGTVWAWGDNTYGAMGDGTVVPRITPIQVPGFSGASAVAAGAAFSQAQKADGTVWAWGKNVHGQLGIGTTGQSLVPVASQSCTGTAAVLSAPTPGSSLTGSAVTFSWSASGASAYWLDVGTSAGQGNIFGQNVGTATSQVVTGLPVNGGPVYVKLWSLIAGVWQANAYMFSASAAGGGSAAVMASPVPGSTLSGATVTFVWGASGASAYWLDVGTALGQGNIFGQNVGTATSQAVTGIPVGGGTIFVKLWSLLNGAWQANSYAYTAAGGGTVAVLSAPTPGSTLAGSSATFSWAASGASAYWLDVGTVAGQGNIFGQNVGTVTSQVVSGLPLNGAPVYVKLWSFVAGAWQSNAYTYTAAFVGGTAAVLTTPAPGSILPGNSVTFSWTGTGAAAYWLDVGTVVGQGNIFGQNVGTATSQIVSGIPENFLPVYVKLWSLVAGTWVSNSYTFTAAASGAASIFNPVPGTALAGSTVTFNWAATSASAYWLDVGTVAGQGDIFGQNVGTVTSRTVTGIPSNGGTIYVKLWSFVNGTWQSNSYTYTAGAPPAAVLATPVPGTRLSGSTVTFSWAATGASAYWLDVGTAAGQGNIFGQNVGSSTSQVVSGLPTNGSTVYVKLWSFISGVWQANTYTYQAF